LIGRGLTKSLELGLGYTVVSTSLVTRRFRSFPIQLRHAGYAGVTAPCLLCLNYFPGFALLAINFFAWEQDLAGAVCFVLSLGFKQMALYYAPAIGGYLLAKCLYLGFVDG
jgi:hypothetical protein